MMTSLLEYLDSDCEMTVLPQPKAPGMAVVPPCTHLKRWQPLRMYLWWGLCTLYLHLCQVRITIWKGDNLWGCTSGGVYLPCTDTHTRWELPSERVTIFEDVPLVEFMYLVFTRMPGENCHLKGWRYLRTYLWCLCLSANYPCVLIVKGWLFWNDTGEMWGLGGGVGDCQGLSRAITLSWPGVKADRVKMLAFYV